MGDLPKGTPDFFRKRIDTMIDLRSPLAVLATRMPRAQIEAALAPKFEHEDSARGSVDGNESAHVMGLHLEGASIVSGIATSHQSCKPDRLLAVDQYCDRANRQVGELLGLKTFATAANLIAGIATMHIIKQGLLRGPSGLAFSASQLLLRPAS